MTVEILEITTLFTFFIRPTKVVVDGLLLCTTRNNVIVKLAPSAIALGINEHDIVPAVVVSTVYQDGVKCIGGGRRLWCLQVRI